MSNVRFALVADDEPAIRKLAVQALQRQGFTCDEAGDGEDAQRKLAERDYELLVTDLRMPKRNGHSLAVEVIGQDPRPLVVILTGVLEPKLATDLIARGVDDIAFKPLDFNVFGAKVKALCDRRQKKLNESPEPLLAAPTPVVAETHAALIPAELVELQKVPPIQTVIEGSSSHSTQTDTAFRLSHAGNNSLASSESRISILRKLWIRLFNGLN
jgi:DNA-binding response OmpR family regulator